MKKIIKITGIIGILILLSAVIAIIAVNAFLKSESFKKMVIGRIETALKAPVEMGHFRTNVFSGVSIDDFNIQNPQDFPKGYSLKTQSIELKYNLYDLLRRNLKIEEIRIVRPDITLIQKEDGTWNLPISSSRSADESGKKIMMAPFLAENIQVIDGNLTWARLDGTTALSIRNFTIKVKIHGINSFPNMDLKLSAAEMASSANSSLKDIKVNLKTSEGMAYLDNLSVNVTGGSIAMEGTSTLPSKDKAAEYTATISLKDIDLQLMVSTFVPELKESVKGLLSADISLKGQGLDADADIKVNIPSFLVLDKIKIDSFNGNIGYSDFDFIIRDITMNVFGGSAEGKGTGTLANIINPEFNMNFNINNVDASSVLTALGQDATLAQGKLSGNLNASGNISDIKASGKISSNKLDIKKIGNLTDIVAPFKATMTKQNKEIEVENFTAKIYGGSVKGNANITFDNEGQPDFSTTLKLSALDAKNALKELTGQTFLTGKADGNMKLSGKGNNLKAVKGSADISLKNGKISSHPIQNVLSVVLQIPALRTIDFETATVSSTIKGGEVNIKNAQLEDPQLVRFDSKGEIRLSDQKLSLPSHLSLHCNTVEKIPLIKGAFSKESDKWCGIDFKISGTLSQPKEDLKDKLAKQAITGVIEQLLDKQNK
ncbi:MAG: type II secretion system protein GspN [Candidatus Ratteibacteria bacterium]|nr:type II secretion system protein GspN [Candidatus Ratteibacteria bacterium]